MKMTAQHIKELRKIRPEVAEQIDMWRKAYRTRRITFEVLAPGYQEYLAEGASYRWFAPNGNKIAVSMVTADTMGVASDGMNYRIGERTPPMPEGTWIVEKRHYAGATFIYAKHVGYHTQIGAIRQ